MGSELTYFSLLGISEDASQEELEARYEELAKYLASPALPANLRDWAAKQAALVDEAYAVLADPERRAAMGREKVAVETAPAATSATTQTPAQTESGEEPQTGRASATARAPQAAAAGPTAQRSALATILGGLRSHPLVFGAVLGVVVLGAVILFQVGLPGDGGAEEAPPANQAGDIVPLNKERIAQLTAAVEEEPNNREALFELGESYFLAGEWQSTIDWFGKLVALEPNNVHALTDIGTSNYNLGFTEEAKATWLKALEFDPKDAQVHYNLGFLYANSEPQDMAAAIEEWQTVVELAPDSNLAQTVKVHLEGLANSTPEASPEASPAAP